MTAPREEKPPSHSSNPGEVVWHTKDGEEVTALQTKLLAREIVVNLGLNKKFKYEIMMLTPRTELALKALMVGIGLEEITVYSNIPAEEIVEKLKVGDKHLGFLPKAPERTERW